MYRTIGVYQQQEQQSTTTEYRVQSMAARSISRDINKHPQIYLYIKHEHHQHHHFLDPANILKDQPDRENNANA